MNIIRIFILKALAYLVLVFAISFLFSKIYTQIVMKDSGANRVLEQFERNRKSIKYLFIGDSHTSADINTEHIDSSFAFGLGYTHYARLYYLLEHLLSDDKPNSIKYVILIFDLQSFAPYRFEYEAYRRDFWISIVNYFELGWRRGLPFEYTLNWVKGHFFSYSVNTLHIFIGLKKLIVDQNDNRIIEKGFIPEFNDFSKHSQKERMKIAKNRVDYHFKKGQFDPVLKSYFFDCIELCHLKGKQVVLLRYPVSNEYIHIANRVYNIERNLNQIEKEINQKGNILILDYMRKYTDNPEFFHDSDHLNSRGSEVFSKSIAEDIIPLD